MKLLFTASKGYNIHNDTHVHAYDGDVVDCSKNVEEDDLTCSPEWGEQLLEDYPKNFSKVGAKKVAEVKAAAKEDPAAEIKKTVNKKTKSSTK